MACCMLFSYLLLCEAIVGVIPPGYHSSVTASSSATTSSDIISSEVIAYEMSLANWKLPFFTFLISAKYRSALFILASFKLTSLRQHKT